MTIQSNFLTNPVRAEQSADPCIRYDSETGYYYAVYTSPAADRIILYRAKKLADLGTAEGKVVYYGGENAEIKHKLYAPEITKMDGKWYIYASGATSMEDKDKTPSRSIRLFCLEALTDDPYGEYQFKALLNKDLWAIDTHAFTYKGVHYVAFARIGGGNHVAIAKLTNPWTMDTEQINTISSPTLPFETREGKVNEGPFTFEHDGRFFMLYSANTTFKEFYCIGILELTGEDLLNKDCWTKTDHAVFSGTSDIESPGHCSVFLSPDGSEHWLAYHYRDGNRKLAVHKFTFDETGFPVFGTPISPNVPFPAPTGE